MGTTQQKFARAFETKSGLKDTINDYLGQNITDAIPFKDYETYIRDFYNRVPKTEYQSGSEVNLGKTIKGKLDFKKEFQEVEYIGSDGHQHIDTGVKGNGLTTNYEIDFETKSLSDFQFIISARTNSSSNRIDVGWGMATMFFGYSDTSFNTSSIDANTRYLVKKEGNKISRNGTNIATIGTPVNFETPVNFVLFANNTNGTIANNALAKLYSCKIYNGDTLVRDFIPCYRISDNVIGLYDKVEGKFYTNAGTGAFTKGADVGSGFDEIVGIGQSSQETTTGKNKLENKATTGTQGGITFTINEDKSVKVNGTLSSASEFFPLNTNQPIQPSTEYILNGAGGPSCRLRIREYDSNNTNLSEYFDQGSGVTFTSKSNVDHVNVQIVVYGNQTNVMVYPMLRLSSVADGSYEQYTNGASPSPNWEQPIEYVRGRNLFNKDKTPENYYIDGSGGKVYVSNNDFINQEYNLRGAVTISFTSKSSNSAYVRVCEYNGSTFIRRTLVSASGTYPLSTNCDRVIFSVDNSESVYFTNLQIEQGSTPHPYTPYNTIEETIRGLNFLEAKMATDTSAGVTVTNNNDGTFTLNGTATGNTTFRLDQLSRNSQDNLKTYENGTYTLSMGNSKSGLGMAMMQIDTYRTFMYVGSGSSLVSRTLTNATNIFIYLDITSGTQFSNFVVKPMLVKGTYTEETLPNFESYITPKTYQLSLGDYEFHGIGNYKDTILCDLENEKVYKNKAINKKVFIGADDEGWVASYNDGQRAYTTQFANLILKPGSNDTPFSGLCDKLVIRALGSLYGGTQCMACSTGGTLSARIDGVTTSDFSSADFKAWLSTHNLITYYALTETVKEEITGTLKDQIIAWCKAHSTNETTIIEMDGDLPLLIEVRGLKGA